MTRGVLDVFLEYTLQVCMEVGQEQRLKEGHILRQGSKGAASVMRYIGRQRCERLLGVEFSRIP